MGIQAPTSSEGANLVARARAAVVAISLAVGGSVLVVTGCGSSGPASNGEANKSASQVVKDAGAALVSSGAAHLAGFVPDSSTKKPENIDLHLQSDGSSGTITALNFPVSIISVGGTSYIKGPTAFWVASKVPAAAAAKLGNRWVKVPADADFSSSFTLSGLASSLNKPDAGVTINPKVTTGKFNGQKVVIVSESDGSQLYVAATGTPYPLRVVSTAKSSGGAGDATFSEFGKRVALKAPAGAIDASSAAA
jgi:hypothetical protein